MTTLDPGLDALDGAELRSQPNDRAAEQSVIAGALLAEQSFDDAISAGLRSTDFYHPAHETIWSSIDQMRAAGRQVDPVLVAQDLQRRGDLVRVGGPAYLHTCLEAVPSTSNAGYYARIVCDLAAKRRAIAAGMRLVAAGWNPQLDAVETQAVADAAVAEIAAPVDESTWSVLGDITGEVWAEYQATKTRGFVDGIRWGYVDVDAEMNPLQGGDLAVVVAWAGGGKSVVAANLALDASIVQGKRSLVHALEMTRKQLGQRWAAKTGAIPLERIIKADLTEQEECRFIEALSEMDRAPLIVDEVGAVSLSRLRASIRKHKPELVIVDQIPIMEAADTRPSREQQLTRLAYGLKDLAKAENVPIVACAQLNSAPMQRSEKLPTLEDIRESRGIGQAATIAVFLWDPCKIERESPRAGELDWIIRKQRQGKNDVIIPMAQQFHYSRLADLARP